MFNRLNLNDSGTISHFEQKPINLLQNTRIVQEIVQIRVICSEPIYCAARIKKY
jgi:hypothetical protein